MKKCFTILILFISVAVSSRLSWAEEIKIKMVGGFIKAPVRLNDVLLLDFALDTGASDVSLSEDVTLALMKSGVLDKKDIGRLGTYTLADGSEVKCRQLVIRKIQIGKQIARDVEASTCPGKAPLLLGQSFFKKLGTWSVNFKKNIMIVMSEEVAEEATIPAKTEFVKPEEAAKPAKTEYVKPKEIQSECDYDLDQIMNGNSAKDAKTFWNCKDGSEKSYSYYAFQLYSDGNYRESQVPNPVPWEREGCGTIKIVDNFWIEDIYGSIKSNVLSFVYRDSHQTTNVVCTLRNGKLNDRLSTDITITGPLGDLTKDCKLMQRRSIKDDVVSIEVAAAKLGADFICHESGVNNQALIDMYQCHNINLPSDVLLEKCNNNDSEACIYYGFWLTEENGVSEETLAPFKTACALGNVLGCDTVQMFRTKLKLMLEKWRERQNEGDYKLFERCFMSCESPKECFYKPTKKAYYCK